MEYFKWDSHFATGIAPIDEQHHWLLDLMNEFLELIARAEEVPRAELMRFSDQLLDYANRHFGDEESLMVESRVDPRFLELQEQQHRAYTRMLIRERRGLLEDPSAARQMLEFFEHWLINHILGCDQSMARQIAAIQAGAAPEEAYTQESNPQENASNALLHALNSMADRVLERNAQLIELNRTLEARVTQRTQALQEAITKLEAEMAESQRLGQELAKANEQLLHTSQTDVLTGLPNRRHAMERLEQLWSESHRHELPLSCILLDADGFKQVNDTLGHDAGDAVLVALAEALRRHTRQEDVVSRLGGDEFLILCLHTPLKGAMALAEHLRASVNALRIPAGEGEWQGSISLGVAECSPQLKQLGDLLISADKGLYLAKRQGRNRVGVSPQGVEGS